MFAPKRYLLIEWANVEQTLRETLRYRYSEDATSKFYKECISRLRYINRLLTSVDEHDADALQLLLLQLDDLSGLVTAIERSHLEEYSWPFAYALERISKGICRDALTPHGEALFFFRAEGGMSSYAVLPEENGPSISLHKIFPVIFPRTLKDSVLLHTILGHEVGHAAISSDRGPLFNIMQKVVADSVVADPKVLFQWCVKHVGVANKVSDEYVAAKSQSWAEEFFCDLFGLITMGPAFIPAFMSLLGVTAFDPAYEYVPTHPPYKSRVVALLHAARTLGLLYSENAGGDNLSGITQALDGAFVAHASPWCAGDFAILSHDRIGEAARELSTLANSYEALNFVAPDAVLLRQLVESLRAAIPPVGPFPAARASSNSDHSPAVPIPCQEIDFRHILLAGWLNWSGLTVAEQSALFNQVNGLCSHAIMQQQALRFRPNHDAVA